jgi:hypothetical protein
MLKLGLSENARTRIAKVAVGTAVLLPGPLIAAGTDIPPPQPSGGPSGVTQTVDTRASSPELTLRLFGGPEIFNLSGGTATFKVTAFQVTALQGEERAAYDMLHGLAASGESADWVALKQILVASGADRALLTKTAKIDLATIRKVATHLEKVGLEPGEDGRRVAADLQPGRTVISLGADATDAQQQVANLLAERSRADLLKLRGEVNAPAIKDPSLQKRAQHLDAKIVDAPFVRAVIAQAHERGFQVDTPNLIERLRTIGPRPEGKTARIDWYKRILESQGFKWRDGENQVNAIGLRAYDSESGLNSNAFGKWNDTLAFAWRGSDGKWNLREFAGTTEPGYRSHYDTPDANGDGAGDVAHALPGQYPYMLGTHRGVPGAGVPEINVPVARDTNHDGVIQNREEKASIDRGDVGYGINLHWGPGTEGVDVGPYSLGCQVTVLSDGQFHNEVTPILAQNQGQMLYSLVDMRELA